MVCWRVFRGVLHRLRSTTACPLSLRYYAYSTIFHVYGRMLICLAVTCVLGLKPQTLMIQTDYQEAWAMMGQCVS